MPLSSRDNGDSQEGASKPGAYVVSPSRLVTIIYVVLLAVVVALGGTFIAHKRARLVRLAARHERIVHSKETGEFKDALLTVGMAIQSELRHFHVGAHLSAGLKSRMFDTVGQLDAVLANTTEESLAAQDAKLQKEVNEGVAKGARVNALGQLKAKVSLWATKIEQEVERYQESQRKSQGRARQDLVGIFHVLQSRSHFQLLQHYGEDGVYRRTRRLPPRAQGDGDGDGDGDGGKNSNARKSGLQVMQQMDPERRAEMLVESLTARQDLTLTLDRLFARINALGTLEFGSPALASKLNELAAAVEEVRNREKMLDGQVRRIRESQSPGKSSKEQTRARLDQLAQVQAERRKSNQKLKTIKTDLVALLAKPSLTSQINFAVIQKLSDSDEIADVIREMQNCVAVKGVASELLKIFDEREASDADEAVRDREAGVQVMHFAKLGSERADLVHAPGALHHVLPFEWVVGSQRDNSGLTLKSRLPYAWWKGYPRAEMDEIAELRNGKAPDLPIAGGKPKRGKLSDRLMDRRARGRKGKPLKRVQKPSKTRQ